MMQGRCLCRAVRYRVTPPTVSLAHCHCESCRRAHSAAFATWGTVAAAQLEVTDGGASIVRYESSPGAFRSFCGRCGSQLFMHYTNAPTHAYFTVASLDGAADRAPARHFSYEEKASWFSLDDALPRVRAKTDTLLES